MLATPTPQVYVNTLAQPPARTNSSTQHTSSSSSGDALSHGHSHSAPQAGPSSQRSSACGSSQANRVVGCHSLSHHYPDADNYILPWGMVLGPDDCIYAAVDQVRC
jgi:hypothetical protein